MFTRFLVSCVLLIATMEAGMFNQSPYGPSKVSISNPPPITHPVSTGTVNVSYAGGYGTLPANTMMGLATSGADSGKFVPSMATTVTGSVDAGGTALAVASTLYIKVGDVLTLSDGFSNTENVTVTAVTDGTHLAISALAHNHHGPPYDLTRGNGADINGLGYTPSSIVTGSGVTAPVAMHGYFTDASMHRNGVSAPTREISLGSSGLVYLP